MGAFFDALETGEKEAVYFRASQQYAADAPSRVQRQVDAGAGGVQGRERHIFNNLLESLAKSGDMPTLVQQYQRAREAGNEVAVGVPIAVSTHAGLGR